MQLVISLAFMATAVLSSMSSSLNQTPTVVEAASNPASGAAYYATNQDDLYYQGIDENLTGENLIVALSTLTSSGFVNHSYSELPNIYRYSDLSMSDNGKMVMVYTGSEVTFTPEACQVGQIKNMFGQLHGTEMGHVPNQLVRLMQMLTMFGHLPLI